MFVVKFRDIKEVKKRTRDKTTTCSLQNDFDVSLMGEEILFRLITCHFSKKLKLKKNLIFFSIFLKKEGIFCFLIFLSLQIILYYF